MLSEMNQEITEVVGLMKSLRARWLRIDATLLRYLKELGYPIDVTEWVEENSIELRIEGPLAETRSCISFEVTNPGSDIYSIKDVPIDVLNKANDALERAVSSILDKVKTLKEQTKISLKKTGEISQKLGIPDEHEAGKPQIENTKGSIPLDWLGMATRSENLLKKAGVTTVEELIGRTESDLLAISGLAGGHLNRINQSLASRHLRLKEATSQ